jgi:hypothetical protein
MAFNNNITPGAPPLLWSNVYEAFTKINENFDILVATVGDGSGLTPINFETLDTSVSPATDYQYNLGSVTHRWKSLYVGEYIDALQLNGVWLGTAQIKGVGTTVNLPANSTIGGDPLTGVGTSLIIDPEKTFFKTIEVDNNLSVVATTFGDTLNLLSGSGINLTVNSASDSIEIDNTGILTVAAGNGISVTTVSGTATVTNDGVRSLQSTTALPGGRTTGSGINISGSTGDNLRITNTGVIGISNGVGITVSTDTATGIVTITNAAPAGNTFAQVEVNGDSANRLVADGTSDVLNITSGQGITLAKTVATDTLTISVNPVFDLQGSVFADDSTLLVDAVSGIIPATVVQGTFTGSVIGNVTGNVSGTAGVATTVTLVSTDTTAATHYITFVDSATGNENVRTDTSLTYNPSSNTLTAGTFATGSLTITGSTIGTTDSSGIVINESTTFNTDVTFENDINVSQIIRVQGSRVINLTELKSIVAASSSFAAFQTRIAALA